MSEKDFPIQPKSPTSISGSIVPFGSKNKLFIDKNAYKITSIFPGINPKATKEQKIAEIKKSIDQINIGNFEVIPDNIN